LATATGSTVEQIADAVGNVYQGSFGKIGKATNDLIEVENKYGQFVVRIGGVVQGRVASTGQVVNLLADYANKNQNFTDALGKQSQSIEASFNRAKNAISGAVSTSGVDKSIAGALDKFVQAEQQSQSLTKALGYLATAINFVGDNFSTIANLIAIGLGGIFVYKKGLQSLQVTLDAVFASLRSSGGVFGWFTKQFNSIGNNFALIFKNLERALVNAGVAIGVFSANAGTTAGVLGSLIAAGANVMRMFLRFAGVVGVITLVVDALSLIEKWFFKTDYIDKWVSNIAAGLEKVFQLIGKIPVIGIPFKFIGDKAEQARLGDEFKAETDRETERLKKLAATRAEELSKTVKETTTKAAPGDGKPADTYLADLIGNFGKARSELNQLQAAMAKITDLNLLAKMFAEASSRAEQFGIVLEKPAQLIQRDYSLAVKKATEELRQHEIQLANDAVTQAKWNNELQETNLQIYEQSLKLADSAFMQKKWWQEIAQTNNSLRENALKLKDNQVQIDIFTQELQTNAQSLQQQEIRLGMASQMATKFAQELQSSALTLKESAMKLADINYQQGLFNNNLTTARQNTQQQQITLDLLNKAYADGTITLQEYASMLSSVDERMLGSTEVMRKALDGANAAVKGQDNSTQATKDLTAQLRTGAISWRQYEQAVSRLDSEGVKKSFINTSKEIERAKSMAEAFAETLTESVGKAGDALANSLTDGIMKGQLKLSSFKDFFGSILNDIAAMIVKKNFVNPIVDALTGMMGMGGQGGNMLGGLVNGGGFNIGSLFKGFDFGNIFGGVGDFFGNIGSWFGGLFADGGYLPNGKVGIVGEAGPEVITGPANITPMDQLGGTTVNPQVNFTINAIDTQTGVEFLIKNKPQIVGMIQSAYNSQGKQGIYR
jgi:phage host-nuclease inhibitor protein Gam